MTKAVSKDGIRKCLVRKWHDFSGYGFNLHAEKGKAGQYVGQIDEASPALAAGLREGDRIVEVNELNIGNDTHKDVVDRIRASGNSVWLLVVDKDTDDYYKSNDMQIHNGSEGVIVVECPESSPYNGKSESEAEATETVSEENHTQEEPVDNVYESASTVEAHEHDTEQTDMYLTDDLPPPPPELSPPEDNEEIERVVEPESEPDSREEADNSKTVDQPATEPTPEPTPEPAPEPPQTEPPQAEPSPEPAQTETTQEAAVAPHSQEEVREAEETPTAQNESVPPTDEIVNSMKRMSAAEMRAALKQKKKPDPRQQKLSAQDKLAMFKRL